MDAGAALKTEIDAVTERLLAAADSSARKEFVARHPAIAWIEIVSSLTERVWREVRADTRAAERLADTAIDVAEVIADPLSLAKSLRAKANTKYALDQHAVAIELHQRAVALFEEAGEETELARTLSGSI